LTNLADSHCDRGRERREVGSKKGTGKEKERKRMGKKGKGGR